MNANQFNIEKKNINIKLYILEILEVISIIFRMIFLFHLFIYSVLIFLFSIAM